LGIDPTVDQEVRDYDVTAGKSSAKQLAELATSHLPNAGIVGQVVTVNTPCITPAEVAGLQTRGVAGHARSDASRARCAQFFQMTFKKADSAQIALKPGVDEEAPAKKSKSSAGSDQRS
jgi:hypothetical protein